MPIPDVAPGDTISASHMNAVKDAAEAMPALADLTDVDLTGQADGDFLSRVSGVWTPVDAPTGGGGGGGSWTGFTPTVVQNATLTVDTGFSDCEYLINGGVAFVRGKIRISGSSGTSGWTLFVTLPGAVAARAHAGGTEADAQHYPVGIAVWENPGTLHQQLVANSLTATQLMFHKPDGYQGAGVNPAAGFDTADTLSLHLTIALA